MEIEKSIELLKLPYDLLDNILSKIKSPYPNLFNVMRTNKLLHNIGSSLYERLIKFVNSEQENSLASIIEEANPGDTIKLRPGTYTLSDELSIDIPIKLIGIKDEEPVIISSENHVMIRTRSQVMMNNIIFCKLGDEVGYPTAVILAETSHLNIEKCCITCGDKILDPKKAVLYAFKGQNSALRIQKKYKDKHKERYIYKRSNLIRSQEKPQIGLCIFTSASVTMNECEISSMNGPAIKVYRGRLKSSNSTFSYSKRGANIIINGGKVILYKNIIKNSYCNGISTWNNTFIELKKNIIYGNIENGIEIHSSVDSVKMIENKIFKNKTNIFFGINFKH